MVYDLFTLSPSGDERFGYESVDEYGFRFLSCSDAHAPVDRVRSQARVTPKQLENLPGYEIPNPAEIGNRIASVRHAVEIYEFPLLGREFFVSIDGKEMVALPGH